MTDRDRWNSRYLAHAGPDAVPRAWLTAHAALLPAPALALDLAMGAGGSAGWLAERGWRVVGLDVADVAVRAAKARWPALRAVVADLQALPLAVSEAPTFDLILDFYYLERSLWPWVRRSLRPGGLLVMETLARGPTGATGGANPVYLLDPGELRAAFRDWQLLDYSEGERAGRFVASLVARRSA